MHRMLEIPEVLLNIFGFISPSGVTSTAQNSVDRALAALARACRAFKEPALDILWSELNDPSPLLRCLPEICRGIIAERRQTYGSTMFYSFTRPLEQAEWDILRSYARRVRCICVDDFRVQLDWKFLITSMDLTPAVNPLFLNLRSLRCDFREEIMPFLRLSFPSLTRLDITSPIRNVDPSMLQDSFKSLVGTSPKIKRLDIKGFSGELESSKIICNSICGWPDLQIITCPQIPLNADTVIHLSRMPSMTQLTFRLSDAFLDRIVSSDLLSFATLHSLELCAETLALVWRILPWMRLPAIAEFTVLTESCPSKQDLASFMASTWMTGMGHTLLEFNLVQSNYGGLPGETDPNVPLLGYDDLQPCMAFHNLRDMNIDLGCYVGLSDDQLVTLGSAWPLLEQISINKSWGWKGRGGITPNGLALLLETCPSLTSIALAINTEGFTVLSPRRVRQTVSLSSFAGPLSINVIDSPIQDGSVDAMATFFRGIVPHFHFILTSWDGWISWRDEDDEDFEIHPDRERWEDVNTRANELIRKHWLNALRHMYFPSQRSTRR